MDTPPQVRNAVIVLWAMLLLGTAVWLWELRDPTLTATLSRVEVFLMVAVTVLLSGIPIYFVSRRQNWARWFLLVFSVAAVVAVWWFPELEGSGDIALEALFTIGDAVALYWLFTGPGAQWFGSKPRGAF